MATPAPVLVPAPGPGAAPVSSTSWSIIEDAARGSHEARSCFVSRYRPAIHDYLRARWDRTRKRHWVDDAVQDVILECFRGGGILARSAASRPRSFRAFLLGTTRNIALRYETGRGVAARESQAPVDDFDGLPAAGERASAAFEKAWARSIVQEAASHMVSRARFLGAAALRRVELLRLRFFDGRPIRDIAAAWGTEAKALHREYARAREEFQASLLEVLEWHEPGGGDDSGGVAYLVKVLAGSRAFPG